MRRQIAEAKRLVVKVGSALVTNGGHVIPGQEGRIWAFLGSHLLGE